MKILSKDELTDLILTLNVYELHALSSLVKSLQRKGKTQAESERTINAIESLLGPLEPPVYGILPLVVNQCWEAITDQMAKKLGIENPSYNKAKQP